MMTRSSSLPSLVVRPNGIGKRKRKKRKWALGADEVVVNFTDEDVRAGGGGSKSKRKSDGGVGIGENMGAGGMEDVIVIDD